MANFDRTLPAPQSDLAQDITDPHNCDFLTFGDDAHERDLEIRQRFSEFPAMSRGLEPRDHNVSALPDRSTPGRLRPGNPADRPTARQHLSR